MKSNTITERPCRESDFRFFAGLVEKTLKKYVEVYFPFDRSHVKKGFYKGLKKIVVLMKGKRRIGIYQVEKKGKGTLEIVRIFLMPAYQGKGIGTHYMKRFEALGCKKIILEVWDNNPACLFYRKLGYKTVKKKGHKVHMEKVIKKQSN
jgi:ribosomal protein S18 acetylase RimI-like enzyme